MNHHSHQRINHPERRLMETRKEQKERRRWQILQAALDLFVRRGYAETTIGQIAEAASMSTGLMFHYFPSKEDLYLALVTIGVEGTKAPQTFGDTDPVGYFEGFLKYLFSFTENEPWVPQMFVLMGRARRDGAPEAVHKLAHSVNQVQRSAKIIADGQRAGLFRAGDPLQLSQTFWASVQGVMEQWAADPALAAPDTAWLMGILRA